MAARIDNFSEEELREIVKNSLNMKEVIAKLGYSTVSGSNHKTVESRIKKYNIDISHFTSSRPIERNRENVFMENSTASQATLRRWYEKEDIEYICTICGQKPIWQGKKLTLILDHINGYNHDNRLSNLRWVCPNCNQQLETTGHSKFHMEKVVNNTVPLSNETPLKTTIKKEVVKNKCVDCGTDISARATRCNSCQNKFKTIPLEQMPVTREELKNLIRTLPFTQIAGRFSVSDNAIRKWCNKFSLPRTKTQINSYSNEEWEKI